jgi:acetyl esterase/lipase
MSPRPRRPRTFRYGPDRSQVADLWLPTGIGPHPVVVVLHGGFWGAAYGRQLMNDVSADLAERGWAAWNLEYRRVGGGGGWPATFADVAAGIDALADRPPTGIDALADRPATEPERDHDHDHGLDLGRVAAVGHSAGGHLALWAAARPGLPPGAPGASPRIAVTSAVSLAGIGDLAAAAAGNVGWDAVRGLMGGRPDEVPDRYALASPAARLPLGVPQLLVHGENDGVVPVNLSRRYAEQAYAAGDDVRLAILPGTGHMDPIDPTSPAWQTVVDWLAHTGACKKADPDT